MQLSRMRPISWIRWIVGLSVVIGLGSCRSSGFRQGLSEEKPPQNINEHAPRIQVHEGQTFLPKYSHFVPVVVKIKSIDEWGNEFAPEINDIVVNGGDFRNQKCGIDQCSLEVSYTDNKIDPLISFQLNHKKLKISKIYIRPIPEIVDILRHEQTVPSGRSYLSIANGVDYRSNWGRPLSEIAVINTEGFTDSPEFTCSDTVCTSMIESDSLKDKQLHWSTTLVTDPHQIYKLAVRVKKSPISAIKTDVTVGALGTEIKWLPGIDYSFESKDYADKIIFLGKNSIFEKNEVDCSSVGICKTTLKYTSYNTFETIRYQIARGSERSPVQTLKVIPEVYVRSSNFSTLESSNQFQQFEISTGENGIYQGAKGEPAIAINIIDSKNLIFEKDLNDQTRNDIFSCNSAGICSCSLKFHSTVADSSASLTFSVKTVGSISNISKHNFDVKPDTITFPKTIVFVKGSKVSDNLERFDLSFNLNSNYFSPQPANRIIATDIPPGITLEEGDIKDENGWTFSCTESGYCALRGTFDSSNSAKTFKIALQSDLLLSAPLNVQLVNQDQSAFFMSDGIDVITPVLASESDLFLHTISLNDPQGYESSKKASKLRIIEKSGMEILNGSEVKLHGNQSAREIDCDHDGKCKINVKSMANYPELKFTLLDDKNGRSIVKTLKFKMPAPFAPFLSEKANQEKTEFKFYPIGNSRDYTKVEFEDSTVDTNEVVCGPGCSGMISIVNPLKSLEVRRLPYRLFTGNKRSNRGIFEISSVETISMKPDITLTAKQDSDDTFLFRIEAKDLSIKNISLQSTIFSYIKLVLKEDALVKESSCDGKTYCEYKIEKKFPGDSLVIDAEASMRYSEEFFFPKSSFKILLLK